MKCMRKCPGKNSRPKSASQTNGLQNGAHLYNIPDVPVQCRCVERTHLITLKEKSIILTMSLVTLWKNSWKDLIQSRSSMNSWKAKQKGKNQKLPYSQHQPSPLGTNTSDWDHLILSLSDRSTWNVNHIWFSNNQMTFFQWNLLEKEAFISLFCIQECELGKHNIYIVRVGAGGVAQHRKCAYHAWDPGFNPQRRRARVGVGVAKCLYIYES